jgi:hypothetical protein
MSQNRYFFIVLLVVLSMVSAVVAMSAPLDLSAPLNRHNFSSSATHGGPQAQDPATGGTDQICIFCHTPHSAASESTLWSRPDPTITTFPLYNSQLVIKGDYPGSSGTQEISEYKNDGSVTYPSGASRLCLSCHDGVTAIGILNDGTSIAMLGAQNLVTGSAIINDNLKTSHPISFVYDVPVRDAINSFRPGDTYKLPLNLNVHTPLDGENKMQCTTCHDPHTDTGRDGLPPFWRHKSVYDTGTYGTDVYAEVCGQCHIGGSPGLPAGDHNPGPGI